MDRRDIELRITGVGCISKMTQLDSATGIPLVGCEILAFGHGSPRTFEVTAIGELAQTLIRECSHTLNSGSSVYVRFVFDDVWTNVFTPRAGRSAGRAVACLKARLVAVEWIKVDGKTVYQQQGEDADA